MLSSILSLVLLVYIPLVIASSTSCPCGWRLRDKTTVFTHRLHNDFSRFSSPKQLSRQWLINGYYRGSVNAAVQQHQQFEVTNVALENGVLTLKQPGYSDEDRIANKPVRVAGIQSRNVDILHGSFRTILKIEGASGASGGSVGSFFWYHVSMGRATEWLSDNWQNDSSEIDIEVITRGTSILNNTINYTSHPSTYVNGTPIFNATRSVSLEKDDILTSYRQHRFDCHPHSGTYYFLDDSLVHFDGHSIPASAGNVQLNLWADGNQLWSGIPSKTDVVMTIKMIEIYYNTSDSNKLDGTWHEACSRAGGPGPRTVCDEGMILEDDDPHTWERTPGNFHEWDSSEDAGGSHEETDQSSHAEVGTRFPGVPTAIFGGLIAWLAFWWT